MPFFVRQQLQISSKILPQIPNFANFVKNQYFRHDGQFSSFRHFFIKNEILWNLLVTIYVLLEWLTNGHKSVNYSHSLSTKLSVTDRLAICRTADTVTCILCDYSNI